MTIMAKCVKLPGLDDLADKLRFPAVRKLVEEALLGDALPAADATAEKDSRTLADGGKDVAERPGG